MYTADIGNITVGHELSLHFYADNLQLVLSGRREDRDILASRLIKCIDQIDAWMASNHLKLNQDKTKILLFAT